MNEDVMVVATADLQPYIKGRPFDLIRDDTRAILRTIETRHFFVPRADAEVSPQWRQIIPYVVIVNGGDVFTLRRTKKQTEVRLHDKVSIGIGGHINPGHDVLQGLHKELDEEVAIAGRYDLSFGGILNDESTEVGRVHLGGVYVLTTATTEVRVVETEKMIGSWVPRRHLGAMREAMESWSQIVYDALLND